MEQPAPPSNRSVVRRALLIFALICSLPVATLGLFAASRNDIRRSLKPSADNPIALRFENVTLSMSHGLIFHYKVIGYDQLVHACWRMFPRREVVVSQ